MALPLSSTVPGPCPNFREVPVFQDEQIARHVVVNAWSHCCCLARATASHPNHSPPPQPSLTDSLLCVYVSLQLHTRCLFHLLTHCARPDFPSPLTTRNPPSLFPSPSPMFDTCRPALSLMSLGGDKVSNHQAKSKLNFVG